MVHDARICGSFFDDINGAKQAGVATGNAYALHTMFDFHNFGLLFAGQCTVCLKG